jgi:hypothetical protein
MMRNTGLIIILFLINSSVHSQETKTGKHFFTGFQSHYGFIIPHTAAIEPVSHTSPYGFELSFNRLHTSYEKWKIFRRYTISGLQLGYFNFQNPDIVGKSYVLSIFTEPIILARNRYVFSVKAGGGASWQTRIHDPVNDSLNKFFSTRISFPLYLSAKLKYRIAQNTLLTLSGCYNHISNGAVRLPNYGINFPTVSLGVEYFPKPFPELNHNYTAEQSSRSADRYFMFQGLTGYKIVYGEPTWSFGISARFTRHLRTFYALNAGAELLFDGGVRRMIVIEDRQIDDKRFSVTAGQDLLFGKVVFTQYLGIYFYTPYKPMSPVYQKYELSYRFMPNFQTGIYLLAYGGDADLFGLAVSYRMKL